MAAELIEFNPNQAFLVFDEFTPDKNIQTIVMDSVPNVSPFDDLLAIFVIYSVDTCKTDETSFLVEAKNCSGDEFNFIISKPLVFRPDILQHVESNAEPFQSDLDFEDDPAILALPLRGFGNPTDPWISVSSNMQGFRLALVSIYNLTPPS